MVLPWSGMVPETGRRPWDNLGAAVQYRPPGVTVTPTPAPGVIWWLLELLGCSRWEDMLLASGEWGSGCRKECPPTGARLMANSRDG